MFGMRRDDMHSNSVVKEISEDLDIPSCSTEQQNEKEPVDKYADIRRGVCLLVSMAIVVSFVLHCDSQSSYRMLPPCFQFMLALIQ